MSEGKAPAPRTAKTAGNGAKPATRIQTQNREKILEAALEVFSSYGYRGSTIEQIASAAAMSKSNLLYYFRSKKLIYTAVLEHILDEWLAPLRTLEVDGDPAEEISAYIARKLELSASNPKASRLFAGEILQGAPMIGGFLKGPLKDLMDAKAKVINAWAEQGRIRPVDPHHLIFMIWATTQHYADFDIQIRALTGTGVDDPAFESTAKETVTRMILEGLLPR
ncbi:HTH-type transcriptional regulator RutR [Breoghania sp. L-A4]|uniref:HTH-type transcriptional regulator RutR n=1 Tax=Breoghania sp. L-A4 TaxID=2304600 RepID=UPI000E35CB9B|nr:HTH-type transcriptional regulator RutR [Breoghania sp. L-A4]AXS41734.1 HTH-type transcriptional regulator RutR [Breoghania sp. L-A4]